MRVVHRDLTETDARAITDRIKSSMSDLMTLVVEAHIGRVWIALGYKSWPKYIKGEFQHAPLHFPAEERKAVVALLRGQGMSTRAIGAATGVSKDTVQRELAGVSNETPAHVEQELPPLPADYINTPGAVTDSTPGQTDRVAESLAKARSVQPITGLDGKSYPQSNAKPSADDRQQKVRRRPITEAFATNTYTLGKSTESLERLSRDDRFARNGHEVSHRNLWDLKRARDRLDAVIAELEARWEG
jgi:hypothetical protein